MVSSSRSKLRRARVARAQVLRRAEGIHADVSRRSSVVNRPGLLPVAATSDVVRMSALLSDAQSMSGKTDGRSLGERLADGDLARAVERSRLDSFNPSDRNDEAVRAVLYGVRGAAGEYWVVDEIADGSLPVPMGVDTVELVPHHQPGVDLVFQRAGGAVATANVKVAQDATVVRRHFEKHPDVEVVYATSDAAADASGHGYPVLPASASDVPLGDGPVVVDIGKSSEEFDREIAEALLEADSSEIAFGSLDAVSMMPWLTVGLISSRVLVRIRAGADVAGTLRAAVSDTAVAGAGLGVGSTAAVLGAGTPLSAAASLSTTVVMSALRHTRSRLRTTSDSQLLRRINRLSASVASSNPSDRTRRGRVIGSVRQIFDRMNLGRDQ